MRYLLLLSLAVALSSAAPAPAAEDYSTPPGLVALEQRMADLLGLIAQRQKAAELFAAGQPEAARAELERGDGSRRNRLILNSFIGLVRDYGTPKSQQPDYLEHTGQFYLDAGEPARAVAVFDALGPLPPGSEYRYGLVQALVQTGQFARAARELRAWESQVSGSGWEWLGQRAALLEHTNAFTLEFLDQYFPKQPQVARESLWGAVQVWKLDVPPEKAPEKLRLLADLSPDWELKVLASAAIADLPAATPDQAATGLRRAAYEADDLLHQPDRSLTYLRRVASAWPDTEHAAGALLYSASLLQQQGRFQEAIAACFELINGPAPDQAKLQPAAGYTLPGFRSDAYYSIGLSRLHLHDYEGALDAFSQVEARDPRPAEVKRRLSGYAFYQGLALEWLGRPAEAARYYLKAAADNVIAGEVPESRAPVRLVNMYEATGQTADLLRLAPHIPSRAIPRIFEIRGFERAGNWEALVALLHLEHTMNGPSRYWGRSNDYEAMEAAQALARHPAEATPPLIAALNARPYYAPPWVSYALGLIGTPEAVAALREATMRETGNEGPENLVYALSIAGAAGRAVLEALPAKADSNVRQAAERLRKGAPAPDIRDLPFPPLPRGVKLPATLEDS